MDTWTLQMGFPVVTVKRDYAGNAASLSQERYLTTPASGKDTHDYKWWVPITFTTPGGDFSDTYAKEWLRPDERSKRVTGLPDDRTPVIFNVQETGYYRTNYDINNWKLIIRQLNDDHTKIHVTNRAQIIDDALNLARAGLLDYQVALGVTSYLNKETEYICWKAALTGLGYIEVMLDRTPAYGDFRVRIQGLNQVRYSIYCT